MCSEVMRTANTFLPPLLGLSQPLTLCICHLSFRFQVAVDSFRPSENRGWAFGGACFIFMSSLHGFVVLFRSSLFLPLPEFIPWQRASGSVGPLMHPPMLLLVKTRREAPYQFPGRHRVVVPRAHTESLIDATRRISRTFNKENRLAICYDRAGCDKSILL